MLILQLIADKGGSNNALTVVATFLILLVASLFIILVYRLWFHPLAKIPGPKYLAACDIFCQWRTSIRLDMAKYAVDLHRKYGPIVRVGPNRLIVEGQIAWPQIWGIRSSGTSEFGKVPGYTFPNDHNALVGASWENHRRQRRHMSPAFSIAALHEQEHIINQYIDKTINKLTILAKAGGTVNIVDWINYTTFDTIGDLCFADGFNSLDGDTSYVHNFFRGLKGSSYRRFLWHYPLLKWPMILILGSKEFAAGQEAGINNLRLGQLKAKARIALGAEPKDGRRDITTYLLRKGRNGERILNDFEIQSLCSILVVAGSETTGTALVGIVYLLCRYPDKMEALTKEICAAFTNKDQINITNAGRLEYLNGVIEEALRMYPPAATITPRVSPGAKVEGHWLPRGTLIHFYAQATNRNQHNFTDPDSFQPERWLSPNHPRYNPRFAHDRKEVMKPFSFGVRDCPGKNLAYADMRVIISRLLYHFEIELLPGQEDWINGQKGSLVMFKPGVDVRLKLRPEVSLD
ncbi:cytochrome P450 [Colletotrichum somersetense]|nr:cytochrome P450 [Colletotrichum somersetense]